MAVAEQLYTAADLWELSHTPEYAEQRLELSEGRLIRMPFLEMNIGVLISRIIRFIGIYLDEHPDGEATNMSGYILHTDPDGRDTLRAPAIGFVSKARIPEAGLPEGYFPGAPDLAVEVVSPNDSADEVQLKVNQYLQYGTRAVWVFYPKSKSLVVHKGAGAKTLRPGDTLDGGKVLPGFSLTISSLFD